MRRFIFASHHKLAYGLKDTVDFLTGATKTVYDINAYLDDETKDIDTVVAELFASFDDEDEVVVLVDLMGGSVYQKFYPYMSEKVHVICGMNLPMALSFVLAPEDECLTSEKKIGKFGYSVQKKKNVSQNNIKKYHKGYGTIDEATTRDQILYGDANQECTGVVTTCWASVDVIRFAIEKGANFIICHEALFWNHGDHTDWLEESKNEVYLEKKQLLDDHGIVVWRNHDYIHSGIPYNGSYIDGIFLGLAKKMNWDKMIKNTVNSIDDTLECSTEYEFDHAIEATDLAKQLVDTCNLNGIKLIGNDQAKIKKAAVLFHVFGDAKEQIMNTDKSDIDCLLTMELIDFTYAEYIRDSGCLDKNRVALGMGHFNLEEPGMEYMLTYLDEAAQCHVPAWFKQSGDNYKYIVK